MFEQSKGHGLCVSQILKENKEKREAEFNERFKNRPQKSLDDEEVEFLDAVERHRRETERQAAEEEKAALINFQVAVAERTLRKVSDPPKPHPEVLPERQEQQRQQDFRAINPKRPAIISQEQILAGLIRVRPANAQKKPKIEPEKDGGLASGQRASSTAALTKQVDGHGSERETTWSSASGSPSNKRAVADPEKQDREGCSTVLSTVGGLVAYAESDDEDDT
ncbi:hypothetical protein CBR_g57079 [Chara braunii]|uniref:FAM192A/Fyv6 N-terminal domain-containing protein n=1 Tax=Chara braunii TaxID=69332 RepID=A0A388K825_CHABU|nr:hypothetical protein CBR_g57079 [Chara braunii]|eukprot:GBG66200.1 hypothetical protein CBR_g57079 [Chara braunii]